MRARFLFPWADGIDSAGKPLRRVPSNAEIAAGYPCGPADLQLHNEVTSRGLMAANELGYLVEINGLAFDEDDPSQSYRAIVLTHLIDENTTLYVPAQYPTIQDALAFLNRKRIAVDAMVTIQLAEGDFPVDLTVGPLILNHPDGGRIRILGQPLRGTGFPTPAEVDITSKPTVEALLRSRFPSRIVITGPVPGIFMLSGTLNLLGEVAIIGDGSPQQDGFKIGEFLGQIGTGNVALRNVYAFNCGARGIMCNYAAAVQGNNVAGTHCAAGILSANVSGFQATGSIICCRNTVAGGSVRDQGFFELIQNANGYFQHNPIGILSTETGSLQLMGAATISIANNTSFGVLASRQSYAAIPAFTQGGGNSGGDFVCQNGGQGWLRSGHSLTISPSANTTGNGNSYIEVS